MSGRRRVAAGSSGRCARPSRSRARGSAAAVSEPKARARTFSGPAKQSLPLSVSSGPKGDELPEALVAKSVRECDSSCRNMISALRRRAACQMRDLSAHDKQFAQVPIARSSKCAPSFCFRQKSFASGCQSKKAGELTGLSNRTFPERSPPSSRRRWVRSLEWSSACAPFHPSARS